jgi:hypothetical protein
VRQGVGVPSMAGDEGGLFHPGLKELVTGEMKREGAV